MTSSVPAPKEYTMFNLINDAREHIEFVMKIETSVIRFTNGALTCSLIWFIHKRK